MATVDWSLAQQCVQALPGWVIAIIGPLATAGAAAHLDAVLKQPVAGSLWLLIRKPLSLLAGNYGWARNATQESLPDWWAQNKAAFAEWFVNWLGDELRAALAKRLAETPQEPAASPPTS